MLGSMVGPMLALLLAGCAAVPSQRASFRDPTDVARLTRPAAGITGLEIQGGAADVDVVAAAVDSVEIVVALRSHDADRLTEVCVPGSELKAEPDGGRIVVFLDQRSRDRCGERWRVRVPASMPVVVRANVGKITTSGLAGGLRVRVTGSGSVDAAVAGGPIDVHVGVGDAKVTSREQSYRTVRLRADVGRVHFEAAGMRVSPPRQGASSTFESEGRGRHEARVKSDVGDVTLVLIP
jgi:hypothetical protein